MWIIREAIKSTAKARFVALLVENTKYGHKTDVRDTTDSPLACKVDNHRLNEVYRRSIGNWKRYGWIVLSFRNNKNKILQETV